MESFAFLHHACAHEENRLSHRVGSESTNPSKPPATSFPPITSNRMANHPHQGMRQLIALVVGAALLGTSATAIAASTQIDESQSPEQPSAEASTQPETDSSDTRAADTEPDNQPSTEPNIAPNAPASTAETPQSEISSPAQTRQQGEPMLLSQQADSITLQLESTGNAVTALQQRLSDLGYYSGPITGYFGDLTEAAVIEFQRDRGLTADGVVGASTTAALRESSQTGDAATVSSDGLLRLDASGASVSSLQTRLSDLGYYDGPITGYFGPLTESAVIEFQQANGLTVDGVVGSATESALQGAARPTAASSATPVANDGLLELGESGPRVADIQRRLRELGYYSGTVDGTYGPMTEEAVIAFQRSQGLTADGIAGSNTVAALESPDPRASSRPVQPAPQPSATETSTPPSQNPSAGQLQQPNSSNPVPSETATPPAATGAAPSVSPAPFPAPSFPAPDASSPSPFPASDASSSSSIAPASSLDRDAVIEIQRKLQARGFYSGPVDGVMGPETQRAIDAAHRAYDLTGGDIGNPI